MNSTQASKANFFIGGVLLIFAVICFFPLYWAIVASFSNPNLIRQDQILLFPRGFSLVSFQMIISNSRFVSTFETTVVRTIIGVVVNLLMQCSFAYALSKKYLPGRKFVMVFIVISMIFNAGIIPTYLIVKYTGLINTLWALIIPGAISTWNVILLRSFFESIPQELEEAARMDGANDMYIFARIYIPLSMPAISTIGLFCAVTHWNSFMDAIIYETSYHLQVLQVFLTDMIISQNMNALLGDTSAAAHEVSSLSIQTAAIVVASIPVLLVYPFIQKYFIKGVMIGAVKG